MKLLVCISQTPDTTAKVSFTADQKFNADGVQFIMNPYDEFYSLVRALELKEAAGGSVTVLNVGPAGNETVIRKGLAIGADDAVRIDAEPESSLFVAKQIAEYAKDQGYDMIFFGKETIDYNASEVPGMVAEMLDLPFVSYASHMDIAGQTATITQDMEGGLKIVKVDTPFVLSASKGMAEQRIPNMRGIMMARRKPLTVVPPVEMTSPVNVAQYTMPEAKSEVKLINPEQMDELVDLLHNDAKVI